MALSTWESVCSWATRRTVVGVDPHHDLAVERDLLVEQVPDDVVDGLDAGHRDEAAGVLDRPDVAHLAAAAGVERRPVEGDPPGRRADDHRAVFVQIRLLVAEVDGHGPNLSRQRHDDGGTITTGHGALRSSRPATPGCRARVAHDHHRPRVEVAGEAEIGAAGDDRVEPADRPRQVVRHPPQVRRHRARRGRAVGLGDLDHRQLDVQQHGQRRRRDRQLLEARPAAAQPDEHPPHRFGRRPPAGADASSGTAPMRGRPTGGDDGRPARCSTGRRPTT